MNDNNIIDKIKSRFPTAVSESHSFRGDQTVTADKDSGLEIIKVLRDDPVLAFNFLMDIERFNLPVSTGDRLFTLNI